MASRAVLAIGLALGLAGIMPASRAQTPSVPPAASAPRTFENTVQPVLYECAACHNERDLTAGLNINLFSDPHSLTARREGWEKILDKLLAGEMPPLDAPPIADDDLDALITYVQAEFERADRDLKPDPGRVPVHRLNRAEYANTVRDLLGVDFRASEEFPADDSGYGFDNIGDVLTVSPTLMQKYLSAAEHIAARAVGGDPLPPPGILTRRASSRRVGYGAVEVREVLPHDAEYIVRVEVAGRRGDDDKPVTLTISVDGDIIRTVEVPVRISDVARRGNTTSRSTYEVRVFATGNEHIFRAEFVNDEDLKAIPVEFRSNTSRNIFPESIDIVGPFPSAQAATVRKPVLLCDPASGAECVERILTQLARRAYRRPVTRADVAPLLRTFNRARAADYTPAQSLQFAITAVLVSPQFLFRIERDPAPGTIARVNDVELASRLSYFLWSSMPDDELLALGETERLHQPDVLAAQVRRMLADPKAGALAENFAAQWLETRSLDAVAPDPARFPTWSPELREAMRTETRLFFDAVLRENRSISDFIDGKYTFLNERLAAHYGLDGVEGDAFRRVDLTSDQRSGVFTQASVLTVSSYPTRTSVVLRGKYLLENVLNAPPPPPPADVPALDEGAVGVATSLREQTERHRADAVCASCHVKMDPLGFALENYDAIGRWRTDDGKFPIDASGVFPNGQAFNGPVELKTVLLDSLPAFTRSLSEKMLTYALRRGVESYDRLVVRELVRATADDGYRLQTLIQEIVKSLPFQHRRGETPPTSVQEARRR